MISLYSQYKYKIILLSNFKILLNLSLKLHKIFYIIKYLNLNPKTIRNVLKLMLMSSMIFQC
jgi:hypothetical protein